MENEQPDVSMFGESSGMADVKLLLEGRSIPVIKAVLGVSSPVFRAMFEGDFKSKGAGEISLPGKKLDDMLTLLKCIYPDILLTITEGVAFTVLPLSEEYQMTSLKAKCEDALLNILRQKFDDFYMKDCVYLYKYLTVSVEFHLETLEPLCVSLASDFKQLQRVTARRMHDVSPDVLRKVENLAISKLETIRDDADSCIQIGIPLKEQVRYLCYGSLTSSFRGGGKLATKYIKDHMRASRLAYTFLKTETDIQKMTVSKIREDKRSQLWCHGEEYGLLPENIKRDIENAR